MISEFVRERLVERLGLDPEHVHADVARRRPRALHARRRGRARAVSALPGPPWPHKNHARLFEAFALIRRRGPSFASCSRASATTRGAARRASRRGRVSRRRSSSSSTGAPPASSSRASTRVRAAAASRRWPAAALSLLRLPARCRGLRRRRRPLRPARPEAIAAGVEEALARAGRAERARAATGRAVHVGRDGPRPRRGLRRRVRPDGRAARARRRRAARRARDEVDARLPAEALARPRRVADEVVELGRAAPQRAGRCATWSRQSSPTCANARSTSSSHRVALAGRDDVVGRLVLLQHQPHRADVVAGVAPVAPGVEIAERRAPARARARSPRRRARPCAGGSRAGAAATRGCRGSRSRRRGRSGGGSCSR